MRGVPRNAEYFPIRADFLNRPRHCIFGCLWDCRYLILISRGVILATEAQSGEAELICAFP